MSGKGQTLEDHKKSKEGIHGSQRSYTKLKQHTQNLITWNETHKREIKMGNRASSQEKKQNFWDETKKSIRDGVDEEITKRMMMQREIQMSVNIAKARDALHVFGSLWLTFTSGVTIATLAKKPVPKVLFAPVVIGSVVLGNMADMAYGNKLARVNKEAAYILENERYRFVPFPQAPFARFYSDEERALFYDEATAVGDLAPFSLISRSFGPKKD